MEEKVMRNMSQDVRDDGAGDAGEVSARAEHPLPQGVSSLDTATKRQADERWPFKFTLEDNRWFINRSRRRLTQPKYEEALW
jgi:hypothetical protein